MHSSAKARAGAFTLVELLAAMLVVTILLLAVVGIVTSATRTTGNSRKYIDADSEARLVFDRIADDLSQMSNRPDVDYALGRNSGGGSSGTNDALFFYSEGPALNDTDTTVPASQQNTAALIGYRINSKYQLDRLGRRLIFADPPPDGMMFLTYPAPTLPPANPPTPNAYSTFSNSAWAPLIGSAPTYTDGGITQYSQYYHVLGESVFRFEYCFLLKPIRQTDGTLLRAVYSNVPYDGRANPTHTSTYGIGLGDVQAIVIALALLDPNSRATASTTDLATLAAALPDPTDANLNPAGSNPVASASSPPQLMAQTWNSVLNNANALNAANVTSTAKAAASYVRIYQRTFYLNPFLN